MLKNPTLLILIIALAFLVMAAFPLSQFASVSVVTSVRSFSASSTFNPAAAQSPACGQVVRDYTNARYDYEVTAPDGWRLATSITSATNPSDTIPYAEFVYFTKLTCRDEESLAATVTHALWGGDAVESELSAGNLMALYANTSDGGLNFALAASKMTFRGTNVPVVSNIASETLESDINAVRYEIRSATGTIPNEDIFVPLQKPALNEFGTPVLGFTMQVGLGEFYSDSDFTAFYRSFQYR